MSLARSDGFTLVEVLLSAAIAVLLAVLAWTLLSTTSRSVASQEAHASGPASAYRVADRIQADLVSLIAPDGDERCAIELRTAPFALAFCTVLSSGRTPDLVWSDPRRVEYVLEPVSDEGATLLRIEETLSGPVSRATNRLSTRITQIAVEFYDGAFWHGAWPPEDSPHARPRASRVSLRKEGMTESVTAEFWIPFGQAFTSTIVRARAEI